MSPVSPFGPWGPGGPCSPCPPAFETIGVAVAEPSACVWGPLSTQFIPEDPSRPHSLTKVCAWLWEYA
jgi:hypothetical protein